MKRKTLFLSLVVLWTISIPSFAQTEKNLVGRVVDSKTGQSIPYATIRIQGRNIGVIANDDGDFRIPLSIKSSSDTLVVSSIGYTTKHFSVDIFQLGVLTILRLPQAEIELNEVVIRANNRRSKRPHELATGNIVAKAIKNIPQNYPEKPYSYVGYYRDYQVRDSIYMNLNEAIVEVFDKGFSTNDQLQTDLALYEYKQNNQFPRDSSTEVPYDNKPNKYDKSKNKYIPNAFLYNYGGNELSILRLHDAIRNYDRQSYSFVNVFNNDFLLNHALKREKDVYLDTVSLYCISFESQYSASGPLHYGRGRIYIQKGNFAIHKLEYAVYNKTMREDILMYDIKVEYIQHGTKFYLNYISFNNFFKTQNDVDFKMIKLAYNPVLNAFVVNFNSVPDEVELKEVSNYSIRVGDTPIGIKYIEKQEERKAAIFLDDAARNIMRQQGDKLSSNLSYSMHLRDINNRELDKHSVSAVNQFRELFVEQVSAGNIPGRNTTLIKKDIPLIKNPPSARLNDDEYWMNPPLLKR